MVYSNHDAPGNPALMKISVGTMAVIGNKAVQTLLGKHVDFRRNWVSLASEGRCRRGPVFPGCSYADLELRTTHC